MLFPVSGIGAFTPDMYMLLAVVCRSERSGSRDRPRNEFRPRFVRMEKKKKGGDRESRKEGTNTRLEMELIRQVRCRIGIRLSPRGVCGPTHAGPCELLAGIV
jgi:hypothetical protein